MAPMGPRSSTGLPMTLTMRHAAHQAVGRVHGDAANRALAQMLGDFDDEVVGLIVDGRVGDRERDVDFGQVGAGKLDVHDGTDDLDDSSFLGAGAHGV